MRNLTLIPIYDDSAFSDFAYRVKSELPEDYKKFMRLYGGRSVTEYICITAEKKSHGIRHYFRVGEILRFFIDWGSGEEYSKLLPLAHVRSGVDVYYSLRDESYGHILLSRWREDDTLWFQPLFTSLEDFVNSLITGDEFMKGYREGKFDERMYED